MATSKGRNKGARSRAAKKAAQTRAAKKLAASVQEPSKESAGSGSSHFVQPKHELERMSPKQRGPNWKRFYQ